jgi:hypothetical protein
MQNKNTITKYEELAREGNCNARLEREKNWEEANEKFAKQRAEELLFGTRKPISQFNDGWDENSAMALENNKSTKMGGEIESNADTISSFDA